MAGDQDEIVGVDELTDSLTEPSQKRSYYDYWNAAYRGFFPAGLNASKDNTGPSLPEGGDGGPEPFDETPQTVAEPYEPPVIEAKPVVIIDNFSRVKGSVEKYFHAYQVSVGDIGTTLMVNRDPSRTKVVLVNMGDGEPVPAGDIFIGETESVGTTGFLMRAGFEMELKTTRQVWAQAATGVTATVYVLVEYEKEI